MDWIDSHCHVQMSTGGADAAIERARAAGVVGMVVVGTDLATSREAVALAGHHPDVRATVGLHPHDASRLDEEWAGLEDLASSADVVAIGETGFDLHYRHSPTDAQERAFRIQLDLACRLDRALVIHTREAWEETFTVLESTRLPSEIVFHCFTGGPDEARRALDLGAHLSFSGIVSFRGSDDVRGAAATCPPERLLVETDAPYLTPDPHRGKENEPALVGAVGEALARAAGLPVEEIAALTAANAQRVLGPFGAAGGAAGR